MHVVVSSMIMLFSCMTLADLTAAQGLTLSVHGGGQCCSGTAAAATLAL